METGNASDPNASSVNNGQLPGQLNQQPGQSNQLPGQSSQQSGQQQSARMNQQPDQVNQQFGQLNQQAVNPNQQSVRLNQQQQSVNASNQQSSINQYNQQPANLASVPQPVNGQLQQQQQLFNVSNRAQPKVINLQDEIQLKIYIGKYDVERDDITLFFARLNEAMAGLSWEDDRKKRFLKNCFDDNILRILNDASGEATYSDLVNLVKNKINRIRFGNASAVLAMKYEISMKSAQFLNSKFRIFEEQAMNEEQRRNWLEATLPDDFNLAVIEREALIAKLDQYSENSRKKLERDEAIRTRLKALEDGMKSKSAEINYQQQQKRPFDRQDRRAFNRDKPYDRERRPYDRQFDKKRRYDDYQVNMELDDCRYCAYLNRGDRGQPNRKHRPEICRHRFEAFYYQDEEKKKLAINMLNEELGQAEHGKSGDSNEKQTVNKQQSMLADLGEQNLMIFQCQLNYQTTKAIYDTGATCSAINTEHAQRLGLTIHPIDTSVGSVAGSVTCTAKAVGTLQIGQLTKMVQLLALNSDFGDRILIGLDCICAFELSQSQDLRIIQSGFNQINLLTFTSQLTVNLLTINLKEARSFINQFVSNESLVSHMSGCVIGESAKVNVKVKLSEFINFLRMNVDVREAIKAAPIQISDHFYAFNLLVKPVIVKPFPMNYRERINPKLNCFAIGKFEFVMKEFGSFAKDEFDIGRIESERYEIPLKPNSQPVHVRPYQTKHEDVQMMNEYIDIMLKRGLIKHSFSNFASPALMVGKKNSKLKRLVIDYRLKNAITVKLDYPLPLIEEMITKIANKRYKTKLDFNGGFSHIPVDSKDAHKTAFRTADHHLEFQVMPQGAVNAPAVFQRAINRLILRNELNEFVLNFIDDVIILSDELDEHLEHVRISLDAFKKENCKLKLAKCQVAMEDIEFLGHRIGYKTIQPLIDHIEAVQKLPEPKNVNELQRVLGKINYSRKFIPNLTELLAPLFNLLNKSVEFVWTESCSNALQTAKNILCSEPVLKPFDSRKECRLYVDASAIGIGGVLKQVQENGEEHPVSYFSRTLNSYQKNYSATEKECLAIVEAIDHYHPYLFDKKFVVYSDHNALSYLLNIKNKNPRLLRWSIKLNGYDFSIVYRKGSENEEADCLSRAPLSTECVTNEEEVMNFINFLTEQELITHQRFLKVEDYKNLEVIDRILTVKKRVGNRIIVPASLIDQIVATVHEEYDHPCVDQTLMILRPNYVFEKANMAKVIEKFNGNCKVCIQNKSRFDRDLGRLAKIGPARDPFDFVSIDSVGGFKGPEKFYLHLAIDHATRHVWHYTSETNKAKDILELLKLVKADGVPKRVLSDRHKNINNKLIKRFARENNITLMMVPSDSASANGMIERPNQTIVNKIRCLYNANEREQPWEFYADRVVKMYNHTPHTVTKFSPAFLLKGEIRSTAVIQNPLPSIEEARELAYERSMASNARNAFYYNKNRKVYDIQKDDKVYFKIVGDTNRDKLDPIYVGPARVTDKLSENVLKLYFKGQLFEAHIKNVRVAYDDRYF